MSIQPTTAQSICEPESLDEAHVADYLKQHPDFFDRHSDLLADVILPHNTGGSAVSLVERQASIMRERNEKLDKKLRDLVHVARRNQELSDKTHRLSLSLMRAPTLQKVLETIESALRTDFGSERAVLVLFAADGKSPEVVSSNFIRRVSSTDTALKPFATFLENAKPRCGQIRDAQREFLFGPDNSEIGSAALLPILVDDESRFGMLAIGNQDAQHFHPAMSTDFLVRLAETITAAVQRFRDQIQ